MLRALTAILIAPAVGLASPAAATPREDAACLLEQISVADGAAIANDVLAGRGGESESARRFRATAQSCAERNGWDEERAGLASGFAAATITLRTARERLVGLGVDVPAVDRWFDRQSDEFRTSGYLHRAMMEAAATSLAGHEISEALLARTAFLVGGYLAARMMVERLGRGMPLQ